MVFERALLVAGMLALSIHPAFAGGSPFIDDMPPLVADPDRAGAMISRSPASIARRIRA